MQAFDSIAIARDLVARDEAQRVFDIVAREYDRVSDMLHRLGAGYEDSGYLSGYLAALKFVMDDLDERIGYLRDRWG